MNLLEAKDGAGLAELKSQVTFELVLKSDEPNFMDLKREGIRSVVYPVTGITTSFLRSAFPDQVDAAADVAVAIVERNPTWTLLDTINFYKTILNRQDREEFRVFGNKITVLKLMEMCTAYEDLKAEAHERIIADEKGKFADDEYKRRESTDVSVRSQMGKMYEQVQIKAEKNGMKLIKRPPANENWFNKGVI